MSKIGNFISKAWKDPVWSKVISVGILALIGIGWAWYKKKTPKEIYDLLLAILNFPVPLYFILSLMGLFFLGRLALKYFKRKSDPLYDEPVGNYTFKELCQVLQREKIEIRTILMEWNREEPVDADLLIQFISFAPTLNQGVNIEYPRDDSGYLFGLFCPKMMSYGLVDKITAPHPIRHNINIETYQTSELGKKFLALWDKHVLKVDSKKK